MSTVRAEQLAVDALRAYLLRTLPAKVTAINMERVAVLKAAVAGPYTIPAAAVLKVGATRGSETPVALTSGSRTTAQLVTELTTAAVAGLTWTADAQDRLTLTSGQVPAAGTPSVLSVAADATGANLALGWNPGEELMVRCAIVGPGTPGIIDGEPEGYGDIPAGSFGVLIGERTTEMRSRNIRDDCHIVSLVLEVMAAEPNESTARSHEYISSCVRAVREVLYEDRTLDNAVQLTVLSRVQQTARTFRITGPGQAFSSLLAMATIAARITVFERS